MSNKYSHSDHVAILSELNTLYKLINETQSKINVADEKERKMEEQRKAEDEIPF
jgi:hypothetical protein|tara:strand:+ start:31 stop:192 length:162 start_codon:yes stop_codon:yes gene_type:complete